MASGIGPISGRLLVLGLGIVGVLLVGFGLAGWLLGSLQWRLLASGVFCG